MTKTASSAGAEIYRALYKTRLYDFAQLAFEIVHPRLKFLPNWHIRHVCHTLRVNLSGYAPQVIVNLPPRTLKTFLCSVVYPVFAAITEPGIRVMQLSGHRDLHSSIRGDITKLIHSPRLLAIFPELKSQQTNSDFEVANGSSIYLGIYGNELIGRGFDLTIIDDPQSPQLIRKRPDRVASNEYFDHSVVTRKNQSATARVLVVQQRLHHDDLSGHLAGKGGWRGVSLPAIATRTVRWTIEDDEYEHCQGSALFPAMESREQLEHRLKEIGGVQFRAQYQQDPLEADDPSEMGGYWGFRKGPTGWFPALIRVNEAEWVYQELFAAERTISRTNPEPLSLEEWERSARSQMALLSTRAEPKL